MEVKEKIITISWKKNIFISSCQLSTPMDLSPFHACLNASIYISCFSERSSLQLHKLRRYLRTELKSLQAPSFSWDCFSYSHQSQMNSIIEIMNRFRLAIAAYLSRTLIVLLMQTVLFSTYLCNPESIGIYSRII